MKTGKLILAPTVLALAMAFFLSAGVLFAQEPPAATETPSETDTETPNIEEEVEEILEYSDYMVKAYTLTPFYGYFSGGTYLENQELGERTVQADGAGDIIGFDGEVLAESRDIDHYDAAHKDIESGPAYGLRVGIYANEDFHLDLAGTYATGKVVTTMLYTPDTDLPDQKSRVQVDEDDGYSLIKGGVHLGYDARPATFWGITPKLGFGLGGLINRYTYLEDQTALYLEGNLGLTAKLFGNVDLTGQVDLTSFAFQVDELGYSNFVKYTTFSLGLTWYLDVVPEEVRAAHQAQLAEMEN